MNQRDSTRNRFHKLFKLALISLVIVGALVLTRYERERVRSPNFERSGAFAESLRARTGRSALTEIAPAQGVDSQSETGGVAEIGFDSKIVLDEDVYVAAEGLNAPLLPADRPDWVAAADDVAGEIHRISIGSELEESIDACRQKFGTALIHGVSQYVNRYLSEGSHDVASRLVHLNESWIRKHLMENSPEYDASIERASGKYRQLWTQVEIDANDRAIIKTWIEQLDIRHRAGTIGIGMVLLILGMSFVHLVVKIADRPKNA